jgi:hypothetical protein
MKKTIYYLLGTAVFSLSLLVSCETVDLTGGETDPNATTQTDINLSLNAAQLGFNSFYSNIQDCGSRNTRMMNQFGTYNNDIPYDNATLQGAWSSAYIRVLKNCYIVYAMAGDNHPYQKGMAEVLEAYTMVTMVDFFGNVPYSESIAGSGSSYPKVDNGEVIYDQMIAKLTDAITQFEKSSIYAPKDLYFTTSGTTASPMEKWIKVANSLKIKIYNNLRLTRNVATAVNDIIADGRYMQDNTDDFNYRYSSNTLPDSRHPDYVGAYISGSTSFMSNSYLKLFFWDKTTSTTQPFRDPRLRYYFYRQTLTSPSGTELPCSGNTTTIPICSINFGTTITGYYGRDHADNTGISISGVKNTIPGLYPAGGRFDNDFGKAVTSATFNNSALGAGISNILDYSYVQFMLAELQLKVPGVNGSALTYLQNGVTKNIAKVTTFRSDLVSGTGVPTQSQITAYINKVVSLYNAAATDNDRLNIIIKEFYIACWGNGIEAYNMYRRTLMPLHNAKNIGMQSPVFPANAFPRVMFYPRNEYINNPNITQHLVTTQVFWDNNPAGAID